MVQHQSFKGIQLWLSEHKRRLAAIVLQITILLALFGGVELYVRASYGYLLWKTPLEKANVYNKIDKVKRWNHKFYENRQEAFRKWPIPIQFFEADTSVPYYLHQPNQAFKGQADQAVIVRLGNPKASWSSNSWGFRGAEFPVQKPAGTFRIVALGASTTQGNQGDLETYPYFLEQELQQRYSSRTIEVINAGHSGHKIADILEVFKQRVLPLQPDLVLFYEGNNNINWGEFLKLEAGSSCTVGYAGKNRNGTCWLNTYPTWYKWAYQNSAIFELLSFKLWLNSFQPPAMSHQFVTANAASPQYYRDTLSAIVREARAQKIPIVLSSYISVAHPALKFDYNDNPGMFEALYHLFYPLTAGEIAQIFQIINQQSASVAQEFKVPYADLAAQFPKKIEYFPFDLIHFNPEGNKILAHLFAEFLAKKGLIDTKNICPKGTNQPALLR